MAMTWHPELQAHSALRAIERRSKRVTSRIRLDHQLQRIPFRGSTGQDDISVASPMANRDGPAPESVLRLSANSIVWPGTVTAI